MTASGDALLAELRGLMHLQQWKTDAACRGMDPALFFPQRGEVVAAAKAVCGGCDVQAECLAYAMNNHENFGVWGGMSEHERRRLRRNRNRAAGRLAPARPIDHGTSEPEYRRCLERNGTACDACAAVARARYRPEAELA